jgi:hypothetical protein
MIAFGIPTLIRFLIGIFLLQGVTGLLVYTALGTDWRTTWPLFLILAAAVGVLVAFWFSTIVGADRRHAVARAGQRFSKEREKIRVKAEQIRAKAVRGGVGRGMSLKTGVAVGGAVGVGVAMMLTQFITLGLVTLTAAGGAALGYGVRARQEKLISARRLAAEEKALKVIDAQEIQAIEPPRRRLRGPREG